MKLNFRKGKSYEKDKTNDYHKYLHFTKTIWERFWTVRGHIRSSVTSNLHLYFQVIIHHRKCLLLTINVLQLRSPANVMKSLNKMQCTNFTSTNNGYFTVLTLQAINSTISLKTIIWTFYDRQFDSSSWLTFPHSFIPNILILNQLPKIPQIKLLSNK